MSAALPGSAMSVVWRFSVATALIVLGNSMSAPVLAIRLQQAGHSTVAVGAFAMIFFLLIGLLIPVIPALLARWGVVRTYRAGCLLNLAGAAVYATTDGLLPWSLGSVLSGAGAAGLWNATEALLAREAPPAQRGRVMGLYQTALGAAFALGAFVPGLLRIDARPVLWLAVGVIAACCVLAMTISVHATAEPEPHGQLGTWAALCTVPMLGAIAFAGGVFEAGLSSVSAAHASAGGLGLGAAASVAGAIGVGSFLCQYPAGMLADRLPIHRVFTGAALLLLVTSMAFPLTPQLPWLFWAIGAVWGGVGGALYTLTMVQVAHAFSGRATAGGAAAMITGYTVGAMFGPPISGIALEWGGAGGLSVVLTVLAVTTLVAAGRVKMP